MKLNVNLTNRINKPEFSDEARKEIALLYLEEALDKEQYEDCRQIIENAKQFGVKNDEVSKFIVTFLKNKGKRLPREVNVRLPNAGRPAPQDFKGRRF